VILNQNPAPSHHLESYPSISVAVSYFSVLSAALFYSHFYQYQENQD